MKRWHPSFNESRFGISIQILVQVRQKSLVSGLLFGHLFTECVSIVRHVYASSVNKSVIYDLRGMR